MRSRFATHSVALAAACLLIAAMAGSTHGARFFGLGDLPGGYYSSSASAVSADGSVVVGRSTSALGEEAFRWTSSEGMVRLGNLPGGGFASNPRGVSADGSVIAGQSGNEAFRWTSGGGMVGLGYTDAFGVSANGSVVVVAHGTGWAFVRWTSDGGSLATFPVVPFGSWATSVSGDSSVVVGIAEYGDSREAFRWTSGGGRVGLGHLPGGGLSSFAQDVSADGSTVVGAAASASGREEAFRWTSDTGMVGLGYLPGGHSSNAYGVSADGSVVVGSGSTPFRSDEAFIWDPTKGIRKLTDVLLNVLSPGDRAVLDGWTLSYPWAISADGRTVVGMGTNPSGTQEAWVAYLGTQVPEPASWMLLGIALAVVLAVRRGRRFV